MQITFISLVGLTAMAGAVGGGGLGDFAIRYGSFQRQTDVTYVTVIIILIMVSDPEYRFLCDQKDDSLERWFQIKIA